MITSADFWDKAAEKYSRTPIRDMAAYTHTLERTRSYLSPGDRALELGCGTGGTARLLAPSLAHITATDISSEMIRIARQRAGEEGASNVRFEVGDVGAGLPKDGPYDVVMAHNLLHLLPDARAATRRIAGLVKPGGFFISKTSCIGQSGLGLKMPLIRMVVPVLQLLGKAPYVTRFTFDGLEAMIAEAGFEIVEASTTPATSMSRYVVARRLG